jgi:hypothetical protein
LSRNQTNLSVAGSENHKALSPPADLWERLDAEVARLDPVIPKDSFTFSTIAERYHVTDMVARRLVFTMCREGKCEEVGRFGSRHTRHFILRDK